MTNEKSPRKLQNRKLQSRHLTDPKSPNTIQISTLKREKKKRIHMHTLACFL